MFGYPVLDLGDGLIYTNYVRGDGFFISNIAPAVMMLADVALFARYHKRFNRRIAIAFWIYILLPIGAAVAQIFFVMFIAMMKQTTEEYKRQKTESARLDTELSMATRIQEDMLPNIFPAMIEALRTAENDTPEDIIQAVDIAINSFVKDAPQFDDLTMLCLEYRGSDDSSTH